MFDWIKRRLKPKVSKAQITEAVAELLSLADVLKISRVDMAVAVASRTIDFEKFDWSGRGLDRRRKVLAEAVRLKLIPPARWHLITSDPDEYVKVADWLTNPSLVEL